MREQGPRRKKKSLRQNRRSGGSKERRRGRNQRGKKFSYSFSKKWEGNTNLPLSVTGGGGMVTKSERLSSTAGKGTGKPEPLERGRGNSKEKKEVPGSS